MSDISKHDGEEERECDHSKKTRIDFLVCSGTICIHDRLKAFGELVRANEGRRRLIGSKFMENRRNSGTRFLLAELGELGDVQFKDVRIVYFRRAAVANYRNV